MHIWPNDPAHAEFRIYRKSFTLLKKLEDVKKSGAEILATECPGCVMQLRGGAVKNNCDFKVLHIAELIK